MVTIIIPTYNEKENIKKIEDVLSKIKGDFDIIFTDGFSTDGTYDMISYPKIQETKYRSRQMNAAAKYARGDYLFFLHCDSIIGSDCINLIENSNLDVGCFTINFTPTNLRVKTKHIAFGDQGIFIKKDIFEKIGGYKNIALMEDYQLSLDLKEAGYKIKQLDYPIYSSSRKFTNKEFKTGIMMKFLQKMYRNGYNVEKIAEIYKNI